MKISTPVFAAAGLAALMLSACGDRRTETPREATPETTAPPTPQTAPPVILSADAVWNGSAGACRSADAPAPVDACLIEAIRSGGGSQAAVEAARSLSAAGVPGHVSAWRMEGPVGIATVTYPFRANTNEGTWLVPTSGPAIDVDADPLAGFEADARWTRFAAANAQATPFAPAALVRSEAGADGGRMLVFSTPLKTCHACATVGVVEVGYRFDAAGAAAGRTLVKAG